jgi:hypothetical protein
MYGSRLVDIDEPFAAGTEGPWPHTLVGGLHHQVFGAQNGFLILQHRRREQYLPPRSVD